MFINQNVKFTVLGLPLMQKIGKRLKTRINVNALQT
jgi:hypothetical protein